MKIIAHDYRHIVSDGIGEEVRKRWPNLRQTKMEYMILARVDDRYTCPQLQLGLPDDCGYSYIHIICNEEILVDADDSYGPNMCFQYEDPDCVDGVLAFIMAILATPRKEGKRQYIGGSPIDLAEWKKLIKGDQNGDTASNSGTLSRSISGCANTR